MTSRTPRNSQRHSTARAAHGSLIEAADFSANARQTPDRSRTRPAESDLLRCESLPHVQRLSPRCPPEVGTGAVDSPFGLVSTPEPLRGWILLKTVVAAMSPWVQIPHPPQQMHHVHAGGCVPVSGGHGLRAYCGFRVPSAVRVTVVCHELNDPHGPSCVAAEPYAAACAEHVQALLVSGDGQADGWRGSSTGG
jgi:hypothetical protein